MECLSSAQNTSYDYLNNYDNLQSCCYHNQTTETGRVLYLAMTVYGKICQVAVLLENCNIYIYIITEYKESLVVSILIWASYW